MKKYLAQEIFADALEPESAMENLAIRLQWIAMEYSAIRTMALLTFMTGQTLSYEKIRDIIVVVSRMMGYDEDDIVEYLENSFERLIWDWGYFSLIL